VVLIFDLEILSDRMLRLRASASLTMILPLIPTSILCFLQLMLLCIRTSQLLLQL